jgi:uncharacterized damage-inducible protein DinB
MKNFKIVRDGEGKMDHRYPIGNFKYEGPGTEQQRQQLISAVAEAPAGLRAAVEGLDVTQLNTPYREGGWTVRQVIHHLPDSHMNGYIRMKLALTESKPVIKPYEEALWAKMPDVFATPPEVSLALFDALQARWNVFLRTLAPADFALTFSHPERGVMTVDETLALYAWHGRHHVAHITALRDRKGWKGAAH